MHWYLGVWKKFAVFEGRAHRTEYWMFFLFNLLISLGLGFVEGMIGTGGSIAGLYGLAILIPSIAVAARRLHDTDRTAWWLLIAFVPLIGTIVLLVFFCLPSSPGSNRFGAPAEYTTA